MKHLLTTGLIFFYSVNLLYGQILSENGLEVEDHEAITVVVENLTQDALDIGLTRSGIESRVNVRLRQVRLKPTNEATGKTLYINVYVTGVLARINLNFKRTVLFNAGDEFYYMFASVYDRGNAGIHGKDIDFIISGLDRFLDQFISDYLDAND